MKGKIAKWAKTEYESAIFMNKIHENFPLTTPKTPDWWVAILKWLAS